MEKSQIKDDGFTSRLRFLIGSDSYSSFEKKSGLNRGYVTNLLKGKDPSRENLLKIITSTKCDALWLISGEGSPFNDKSVLCETNQQKSPSESSEGPSLTESQVTFSMHTLKAIGLLAEIQRLALQNPLFAQEYAESARKLQEGMQNIVSSIKDHPAS